MMNIISLEGTISGLNRIKERYKNTEGYYKYDILIFKQDTVLTDLTGNLKPSDLIKEMYYLSREWILYLCSMDKKEGMKRYGNYLIMTRIHYLCKMGGGELPIPFSDFNMVDHLEVYNFLYRTSKN